MSSILTKSAVFATALLAFNGATARAAASVER